MLSISRSLIGVTLAASVLAAQAPEQPTFRTGTTLVRVDATVIDRKGEPVTSLTADDFEVREDGRRQPITSFKFLGATGQPTDNLSLPIRGPQHMKAEAARDDVRVFLFFWDEYHVEQFGSALSARAGLQQVMLNAFGPTDLVAIMDQLTPTDAIRFTRDRRALADQASRLEGRQGVYLPFRSEIEREHLRRAQQFGEVEGFRGEVTRTAIEAAMVYLGTLREGRKNLIIVSESLGAYRLPGQQYDDVSRLMQTASDNNTAVYVFDPRGIAGPGNAASMLAALAEQSGGEVIRTNDLAAAFPRVVRQSSAVYLLGYQRESRDDGDFHKIKVSVRRPGLEVRARAGYWAPRASPADSRAPVRTPVPAAVEAAFKALTPVESAMAAEVWAGVQFDANGGPSVTAAWTPRQTSGSAAARVTRVSVKAVSGGAQVFGGDVAQAGTTFTAPPGPLTLSFNIFDEAGEQLDRVERAVEVPDPTSALIVATPAVIRATTAPEYRALASMPAPPVYAGRDFDRTDRVIIRLDARSSGGAPTLEAVLLDSRGAKLVGLRIDADVGGGAHLELPLSSIARGEYALELRARTASADERQIMAFRVVR